jgi:hypothetical protein
MSLPLIDYECLGNPAVAVGDDSDHRFATEPGIVVIHQGEARIIGTASDRRGTNKPMIGLDFLAIA